MPTNEEVVNSDHGSSTSSTESSPASSQQAINLIFDTKKLNDSLAIYDDRTIITEEEINKFNDTLAFIRTMEKKRSVVLIGNNQCGKTSVAECVENVYLYEYPDKIVNRLRERIRESNSSGVGSLKQQLFNYSNVDIVDTRGMFEKVRDESCESYLATKEIVEGTDPDIIVPVLRIENVKKIPQDGDISLKILTKAREFRQKIIGNTQRKVHIFVVINRSDEYDVATLEKFNKRIDLDLEMKYDDVISEHKEKVKGFKIALEEWQEKYDNLKTQHKLLKDERRKLDDSASVVSQQNISVEELNRQLDENRKNIDNLMREMNHLEKLMKVNKEKLSKEESADRWERARKRVFEDKGLMENLSPLDFIREGIMSNGTFTNMLKESGLANENGELEPYVKVFFTRCFSRDPQQKYKCLLQNWGILELAESLRTCEVSNVVGGVDKASVYTARVRKIQGQKIIKFFQEIAQKFAQNSKLDKKELDYPPLFWKSLIHALSSIGSKDTPSHTFEKAWEIIKSRSELKESKGHYDSALRYQFWNQILGIIIPFEKWSKGERLLSYQHIPKIGEWAIDYFVGKTDPIYDDSNDSSEETTLKRTNDGTESDSKRNKYE